VAGAGAVDAVAVGVVGVGRMGAAMAQRLRATHEVIGYDVRPGLDVGVPMAATPAALAERCDVVLLSLPSPRETRALFEDAAFRRAFEAGGAVAVDTSTSDPASIRALAAELGVAGARLIDAPVLGRPDRCGAWTLPVGGEAAAVERARPVLERLAARVEHVGALGSGHTVKLLNNLMFAAINVVTAEAIAACDALGLDPARFVDLIAGSQAATVSPLFRDLAPRMLGEDHPTVFTVALLAKDLQLAARMCEDAGAPLVSARASQVVLAGALQLGLGEEDSAALVDWYRRGG
jgi:3-hydroxyisobutyrate dehydrogenase-like beta-hydroxyacid dehydrogenase